MDQTLKVIIKGHFYDNSGYAKVNRNLAFGLQKLGLNISVNPIDPIDFNNYSEEQIASALIIINILSFGLSGISSNINLKMEMNNRLIDSKKYNETLRFLYLYQSNILEDFVEYIKP